MNAAAILAATMLLACATPALAEADSGADWHVCEDRKLDVDQRIDACKAVLAQQKLTSKDNAAALSGLGLAYEEKGFYESALGAFTDAIAADPGATYIYANRASLENTLGKTDKALADCSAALAIKPGDPGVLVVRATIYATQRNFDLAIADATSALTGRQDATFYFVRGEIYREAGKPDLALADLSQSLALEAGTAAVYNSRGRAYDRLGRHDLAVSDFNTAIGLSPEFADAYVGRASAEAALGDYTHAISDDDRAASIDPKRADAWNDACWFRAVAMVEPGKAEDACRKAVAILPANADLIDSLGFALFRAGKFADAIASFTDALAHNPKLASSQYMRGICKLRTGDASGAADIAAAKAMDPNVAAVYARYGVAEPSP
ncbi:MAG TPA: tetratricopeptide repeat protein [Rhizomicrobium sp.]|nr:tetratricopeptide repeat protein [Rhizomicrobium sp.]